MELAWAERVWPVLAFLVAVTVVAELADAAGLFRSAADVAARAARGRVFALWLLVVVLATVTTAVFSLDTTAVLLTPVVLALVTRAGVAAEPFAMTLVWLANTASLTLPVANLTNLLAEQRLGWGTVRWVRETWPMAVTPIVVTVVVAWLLHRRALRGRFALAPAEAPPDRPLFVASGVTCAAMAAAIAAGVPPWVSAGIAAGVLLLSFAVRGRRLVAWRSLVPVRLVLVTVGVFALVAVAERLGLTALLRAAAGPDAIGVLGDLRIAAVGAGVGNVVNNLPAYLAVEPVAAGSADRHVALLLGTNCGPLLTVWASLATLLWRERCRAAGVTVSARRFALHGAVLLPPLLVLPILAAHAV